jgi:hypothetical protein
MNTANIGDQIAVIKGNKKKTNLYISNETDQMGVTFYNNIELKDATFQVVPNPKTDRTAVHIAGANGSGKSTWIRLYLIEFKKMYPSYPVRLISSKDTDKELDSVPGIKRIKIDESIIEDPINYEHLSESMIIFDDIDAFTGKIKKSVYDLRNIILKNGRSYKCHIITSAHALTGLDEKVSLFESNIIVFFFLNYNAHMKYFLENYIGLKEKHYKKMRLNKSRATAYIKTFPNVFIQEKNAYTLNGLMGEENK